MNQVKEAIVVYLQQHGYKNTAERFLDESKAVNELENRAKDVSPKSYSESYSELHEWINSSLDSFRDELWPVSWAVFVHFYLELVQRGHGTQAVAFRKTHETDHIHAHHEDIQQLAMIVSKQQLQSSEFAKRFLTHKIQITLCQYTVELLVDFLLDQNLLIVLSIINRNVQITQRESMLPPVQSSGIGETILKERFDADTNTGIIAGISDVRVSQINRETLFLGIPPKMRPIGSSKLNSKLKEMRIPEISIFMENIVLPLVRAEAEARKLQLKKQKELEAQEKQNEISGLPNGEADEMENPDANKDVNDMEIDEDDEEAKKPVEKPISQGEKDALPKPPTPKEALAGQKRSTPEKATIKQSIIGRRKHTGLWPTCSFTTFLNVRDSLVCADTSRDSSVVVAGFDDSKLMVWNHNETNDASEFGHHGHALRGHSGPVYGCSISRDNKFIVSASEDGTARLWANLIAPDQEEAPSVRHLDKSSMQWRNLMVYRQAPYCPLWDVKFSPWGYYFVTASQDRCARLYNSERKSVLRLFSGHLSDVSCIAWHPNCKYVATGSWDKTARLWDIDSGRCVRLFCGHIGAITSLAIDPTGRYLASAAQDKMTMIWDLDTGKNVNVAKGHTAPVWSLSYSDNGKLLASGGGDCTVRVWDTKYLHNRVSGQNIDSRNVETCRVFHTKFTPVVHVNFKSGNFMSAAGTFSLPHVN